MKQTKYAKSTAEKTETWLNINEIHWLLRTIKINRNGWISLAKKAHGIVYITEINPFKYGGRPGLSVLFLEGSN